MEPPRCLRNWRKGSILERDPCQMGRRLMLVFSLNIHCFNAASHCFTMLQRPEVEAHVQRINRGPDGDLISYDLTAKAQAQHKGWSMAHALAASERAPCCRQIFPEWRMPLLQKTRFYLRKLKIVSEHKCILGRVKSIGFMVCLVLHVYFSFMSLGREFSQRQRR